MARPPGSFIWYELMTTHATAAAKFYGAVVGWKIADSGDPAASGGQDYRMIARSDGGSAGGMLQLTPEMLQHGATPTWLGYLHVADVDAAIAAIEADGGKTLMPKRALPVGDIAMMADPMGTPTGKPEAESDVFDPKAAEHVRWNELPSPDLARAKVFYAKHFGFVFKDVMPMGPAGDYCFFDHAGVRLGAIMQKPPQGSSGNWTFYFGVRSIAVAKQAIETSGGTVIDGPQEVPGGDWIVVATDPQGAVFGVVGPQGQ
jgi:uncharacterized protein